MNNSKTKTAVQRDERLAIAWRHVLKGSQIVARQQALAAKLDRAGNDKLAGQANALLSTLKTSLRLARENLLKREGALARSQTYACVSNRSTTRGADAAASQRTPIVAFAARRQIRRMTLPRVQPITPTWRKEPFDDSDSFFEVKYDGFRALCYVEQGRSCFISRRNNVMTRFDALGEQLARTLNVDDAVIDGEVVAVDETGRPQFYDLLRGTRAPAYVAFDLVWLNGDDLRPLPLSERRRRLQGVLPKGSPIVSGALSVTGRGREMFDLTCAHDLEGIIAKRLADPYHTQIRWLKIRNPRYSQNEGRGDLFNAPRLRPWKREEPYRFRAGAGL